MLPSLRKANFMLRYFGLVKVPLIGFCRPKILVMTEQELVMKIPLRRRTKNHLNSMYFGALAVGADVAGAFLAFAKTANSPYRISLAFKAVEGEFLKRPEDDVVFTCKDGALIDQMLEQSAASGERVNQAVEIIATCPKLSGDEVMARFSLTLSLKASAK
ncbi:DUF4442 domain-containing protein [Aliagarivorans taiwanensis]|uniref:DUF4442 domain-containing protein n=1 Tax=Aliagarivorans taiwanensis TaxID=561966 RepID=UPI0004168604|nr:DUF4442 domain-containing protein [Aliagarivorans taiwanensis]